VGIFPPEKVGIYPPELTNATQLFG
jgi:hypothetical protein